MITLDVQTLVDVLVELRSASMKTSTNITEENIKNLIDKYDMLFLGEKLNAIYSMELSHALRNYFKINVSNEQLNKLLPDACKMLNMKLEPMIYVKNLGKKTTPDIYKIILW